MINEWSKSKISAEMAFLQLKSAPRDDVERQKCRFLGGNPFI